MLHLTGRIPLGRHIGDFFHLEGSFKGNREIVLPSQVEIILAIGILFGQLLDRTGLFKYPLHEAWQLEELPGNPLSRDERHPALPSEIEGEE